MMVSRSLRKLPARRRKDTKPRPTYFSGCQGQREYISKSVSVFPSPFLVPFQEYVYVSTSAEL